MSLLTLRRVALGIAVLLGGTTAAVLAEPAAERTVVEATAETGTSRVLVRWRTLDGARRFTHVDVMRRAAHEALFTRLNLEPLGPLTSAAAIEAVFTAPGRADALAGIVASLGPDYATDLVAIAQAGLSGGAPTAQAVLLPDLNYGAALALGLGYLDENLPAGATYVYEVWGVDALGKRVERLGRATATVGSPAVPAPPQAVSCVDPGDERAHRAAFLRWQEPAGSDTRALGGYDVLRARRLADGSCPDLTPGAPGVVKANAFPALRTAPGQAKTGAKLYAQHCASCHASRDAAPVAGSTLDAFRRRLYPEILPQGQAAAHDTAALHAVADEDLKKIYDYVNEFHYQDDGTAVAGTEVQENETWCYRVVARDLLGHHGQAAPTLPCTILDRRAPDVPSGVRARRVGKVTHETCEISFDPQGGDVVQYQVFRAPEVPRLSRDVPAPVYLFAPPPGTGRVTFGDAQLGPADAGQSFFYAVRARDAAGNVSALSAWVPCVTRDIVAPQPPGLIARCPKECAGGCTDKTNDAAWLAAGGAPQFRIIDPKACLPEFHSQADAETFKIRPYRSFGDDSFEAGADVPPGPFTVDFKPLVDTLLTVEIDAIDRSGNRARSLQRQTFAMKGNPLPPPRVVSVALVDEAVGRVKVTFRSLKPAALLGFSLHRSYQGPNDAQPTPEQFVFKGPDANLGGAVGNGQWAVKTGAQPLSKVPGLVRTTDPDAPTFLYYNDLEDVYVLQADVEDVDDLRLTLGAIGWSGQRGHVAPHAWDGWTPPDGRLAWPQFRDENAWMPPDGDVLTATVEGSPARVRLAWTAYPAHCDVNSRPFVVFRQRGGAPRWQQVSPPFNCNLAAADPTQLSFVDTDVEPGFQYRYRVVRQDAAGEFSHLYMLATASIP